MERLSQLADGVFAAREAAKHSAPSDIPQRMKDDVQTRFEKINHVVEYGRRLAFCQPPG
jgi:hypothetical protein